MTRGVAPIGSDAPWSGGPVGSGATCVLAPNPSALTLDGTNTWILGAPDDDDCVVVDPGPADPGHLARVRETVGSKSVAAILLTHGHRDHAAGATLFAGSFACRVLARDPGSGGGVTALTGGDVFAESGTRIHVVATPGHSADSLSFFLPGPSLLLTGDTVLGRGTAVIAHPDGSLSDYLASLSKLRELAEREGVVRILPGHGPPVYSPTRVLDQYLAHRRERLQQVREAVRAGAGSAREVVDTVYQPLDPLLLPAALASVRAQLAYLSETGGV